MTDEALADPGARIDSATIDRFLLMAADASGDPAFVLELARHMPAVSHHLYFAMVASETIGDALERAVRFRHLFGDQFEISLESHDDLSCLRFECPEPERGRWLPSDLASVGCVMVLRCLTMNPDDGFSAVELRRPEPEDPSRFHEILRCQASFGMRANRLYFPTFRLRERLPLSNPRVAVQAEAAVVEYLAEVEDARLETRVRRILMDSLPSGRYERHRIARSLGMSSRTMSRGLAGEGTSYREMLEEVRGTLAREYLRTGAIRVGDIALRLGFSDTSAFSRAFRRWTAQAPSEYARPSGTSDGSSSAP